MAEQRSVAVVDRELMLALVACSFDEGPTNRFWAKVDQRTHENDGCWIWTGALSDEGYGNFSIVLDGRERTVRAHRVAWFFWHQAAMDEDHYLDHFLATPTGNCAGRFCVNPAHLEPVPKHVNDARRTGYTSKIGQRTARDELLLARENRQRELALQKENT